MTDERSEPPDDVVGSLAEEAALLFGAVRDWARDHAPAAPGADGDGSGAAARRDADDLEAGDGDGPPQPGPGRLIADGSDACRICPVCQLVAAVRQISPETVEALGTAALGVLAAVRDAVEQGAGRGSARDQAARPDVGVQKIDLADD